MPPRRRGRSFLIFDPFLPRQLTTRCGRQDSGFTQPRPHQVQQSKSDQRSKSAREYTVQGRVVSKQRRHGNGSENTCRNVYQDAFIRGSSSHYATHPADQRAEKDRPNQEHDIRPRPNSSCTIKSEGLFQLGGLKFAIACQVQEVRDHLPVRCVRCELAEVLRSPSVIGDVFSHSVTRRTRT